MAVESRGDLASRHGRIGRVAGAHSGSYRSDNPICTRTLNMEGWKLVLLSLLGLDSIRYFLISRDAMVLDHRGSWVEAHLPP